MRVSSLKILINLLCWERVRENHNWAPYPGRVKHLTASWLTVLSILPFGLLFQRQFRKFRFEGRALLISWPGAHGCVSSWWKLGASELILGSVNKTEFSGKWVSCFFLTLFLLRGLSFFCFVAVKASSSLGYCKSCAHSLQSCPTLCDPIDCSLPGSSVHGVHQARILARVAISFSRGSSQLQDWTCVSCVSCIVRQIHYHCTSWIVWLEAPSWVLKGTKDFV